MPDEIVFYTNPMSRGRLVRWMLEELGQPYRTEVLEYGTTMKAPDYLAINPMGKGMMAGYGSYEAALDTLEKTVADRAHLVHERFSAADLYVGSHLNFGMMFGSIELRPAFQQYTARLTARLAFARAAQIDDALMPAQPRG